MGLYSRAALVAYLLVVSSGTVAAVLVLPTLRSVTSTGYGQVLIVKLLLVTAVTAAALRSRRALRRDDPALLEGRGRWRQPGAMTCLLALAAVLVSMSPPRLTALAQQEQPPPAPTGPVVELGTLAGQFGVGGRYLVELTLAATGRVTAERLVTPNHLIERTFTYR